MEVIIYGTVMQSKERRNVVNIANVKSEVVQAEKWVNLSQMRLLG